MAFKNLMEGACGEVNSLEQLSSHMMQDVARQDSIGHPSRPQNNFMPPQSFRMHDLMNEMETIEPQRSVVPVEHNTPSLDSQWTTECHKYEEARGYSNFLPDRSFENVNMVHSIEQPPWNIGLPNPQVSWPFYPQHNFEPQLEESGLVVHSLDQLNDSYLCVAQNEPPLENMVKQDTKPVPQKYWNGIPIFDESVLSHMLATKTKTYTFMSCLNEYGKKCSDEQWMPESPNQSFEPGLIRDKLIPSAEEYPHIEDNPVRDCDDPFTSAKREYSMDNLEDAILYADEAARQNPDDINRWSFLQILYQNELRYIDSFFAAKQILRLDPSHTLAHSMITVAYLQDGCFYEAFAAMLHWLINHESYSDIPLNFSMVENLSGQDGFPKTWIDSNQHIINGVKNMLLTAARRNPTKADIDVQSFLSFIFTFTLEFDKSADCLTTIAHSKKRDARDPNAFYNAGVNLFLGDKPHEALDYLLIGIQNSKNKVKDLTYELISIIYMYLTDYREAIRYFKKALEIDPLDEEFALPNRGDILKAENELCLLLYSKLYNKLNPK